MGSYHAVMAFAMSSLAAVAMSVPVILTWFLLVMWFRDDRIVRIDLLGGLGSGLVATGAATALGTAVQWTVAGAEPQRLIGYVPVIEETLKALAIVAALGFAVFTDRETKLPLRRCAVVTVAVVAAFATGENLGHLGTLLLTGGGGGGGEEVRETLRVRAVLPPLGHLAETWAFGAGLWLASRCRSRYRRAAVLLGSLALACGVHALWNASALLWWPDPGPLLAILVVSLGAAAAFGLAATHRQRRELDAASAPVGSTAQRERTVHTG